MRRSALREILKLPDRHGMNTLAAVLPSYPGGINVFLAYGVKMKIILINEGGMITAELETKR